MSGSESGEEMEVKEVIGERKSRKGVEFLVRWEGFSKANDTWESIKSLANASAAIEAFRTKIASQQTKKPRKSTSRSRSRSRSRGTRRSSSRSPARQKKRASPARKSSRSRQSLTTTTTTANSTPTTDEVKTETVTESPGSVQKTTETITRSVVTPAETQRTSSYSRTIEVLQSNTKEDSIKPESAGSRWWQCCCSPFQSLRQCCAGVTRSDYPAMVVFITISIIMLSFVVQEHVNFEEIWKSIVGFFAGLWAWLSELFPKGVKV